MVIYLSTQPPQMNISDVTYSYINVYSPITILRFGEPKIWEEIAQCS